MSALYQNGASSFVAYLASSTIHVVNRLNLYARQDFGFGHVGCQERSQRHQFGAKHLQSILLHQSASACRNHNGVDDNRHAFVFAQCLGNGVNGLGIVHHSYFHRRRVYVVHYGTNLSAHYFGSNGFNAVHSLGVLHGHGCDGRGCIHSQSRHCLDVGLYAGTSYAVASGYSKGTSVLHNYRFISGGLLQGFAANALCNCMQLLSTY